MKKTMFKILGIILCLSLVESFRGGNNGFGIVKNNGCSRTCLQMNIFNKWLQEKKITLAEELQPKTKGLDRPSLSYREPVEQFFRFWNERDMENALLFCDEDCIFEDTLFPRLYNGRDEIRVHLNNVANALPTNFQFIIDEIAEDQNSGNVGIQWHVEADGKPIPFTRGASMYKVNEQGLISKGFDVPEPVLKIGSINLNVLKIVNKLLLNPVRLIPFFAWFFYIWFLFLSDIPPGVNVFHMQSDTITEVINLSLNFWLFLPIAFPQFAPSVHPMLEGVFNLVLIWSLLFAGFLVDGKKVDSSTGKEKNDMLLTVAGMQFLTNAFYLPYLFTRDERLKQSSENYKLTPYEQFFESKAFPVIGGVMGSLFILWALFGRNEEFGTIAERFTTFQQLISQDRLSFSFLFDAFFYSLFQGWLIREDYQRRSDPTSIGKLPFYAKIGTFVPFFGLASYLTFRSTLPKSNQVE